MWSPVESIAKSVAEMAAIPLPVARAVSVASKAAIRSAKTIWLVS